MDSASIFYLGTTVVLFVIFAFIVKRTLSRKEKELNESAKFRMMDDN